MRLIKLIAICSLICLLLCGCDDNNSEDEIEYFPVLEVEADTYYDLGFAVGTRFEEDFLASLEVNESLLTSINQIIAIDSVYFYENLLENAQQEMPDQIAELQGMSDGSGIDFKTMFIFNALGEILALFYGTQAREIDIPETLPLGCSDILYKYQTKLCLAHNEDGFAGLNNHMFIVRAKLTGKPEFISFSYPALVLGIGPSVNDSGLVLSNNFVGGANGDPDGVPAYMVNRKLLEFSNIQQVTDYLATKRVANCINCNIVSQDENRVVSIEMYSNQYSVHEVDGLYAHTNHFVHPDMLSVPVIMDESTLGRYQILQDMISEYQSHLQDVSVETMHSFLNAVVAEPDPEGGLTTGATLSSSIFDFEKMVWRLYYCNPNDDLYQEIEF